MAGSKRSENMASQNKRRASLGVNVRRREKENKDGDFFSASGTGSLRGCSSPFHIFLGESTFSRSDRWKLLRRAKTFLSRRTLEGVKFAPSMYGKEKHIGSVLDCFPALKHSYSSPLPARVVARNRGITGDVGSKQFSYFDVCCAADGSSSKARVSELSRSSSIRLDPVDAPRQLFMYRCRIQKCLTWAYSVGLVPVMMTLTVFHRWHSLKGLLHVLSRAWNYFFTGTRSATQRANRMGLCGYIRRAEETINNVKGGYNSGWHPHYHVILFVPRDKVSVLSDMEDELREAWFVAVNRYFLEEYGEEIDSSYVNSFKEHGLFLSRFVNGSKRKDSAKAPLRPVDDSEYMAKVIGCSSEEVYAGDKELTFHSKCGRIPFDLLLEDTAENNDLWVEYALATKGVRSFVFSRGLESRVKKYFELHPERLSERKFVKRDKVVAQMSVEAYGFLYDGCKVEEMLRVAVKGYDALLGWFKRFYFDAGFSEESIPLRWLPLPPGTRSPFDDSFDVLSFVKH